MYNMYNMQLPPNMFRL